MENSKYKSIAEWRLADPHAYVAAYRLGCINEIREKMGWVPHNTFEIWYLKYNLLKKYVELYDKYPVQVEKFEGFKIVHWCTDQRSFYKKGKLSQERIDFLEELKKWTWQKHEDTWQTQHDLLKKFILENGVYPKKSKLARWVDHQKNYQRKGKLSQERINLLEQLNNWSCEIKDDFTKIESLTKEECLNDALKYTSRTIWKNDSPSSYKSAKINGWLEECCYHMKAQATKGFYTLESLMEIAKKYNSRYSWELNDKVSFNKAKKKGWLNKCGQHMTDIKKPNGYYKKK